MSQDHVRCTDCGTVINTDKDKTDTLAPCPTCGSFKRTATGFAGSLQPSKYTLDNFVAYKLSELVKCGVPELDGNADWLGAFILNSVFIAKLAPKPRAYAFNFLRRAEGALSSYRAARLDLIQYVQTPRNVLSPYFRALLHFESCISLTYQGLALLATAAGEKKPFDSGDKSKEERLYKLYIHSKHMDGIIESGQIPTDATAALWITNEGLACSKATLSFEELVSLLKWIAEMADRISKFDFGSGSGRDASPT